MVSATLVAIVGSIVLLFALIKGHLYVTRKLWAPMFEEEVEGEGPSEGEPGAEGETGDGSDDEPEAERVRRGWDEVG